MSFSVQRDAALVSPRRPHLASTRVGRDVWASAVLISSYFLCIPLGRYSLGGIYSDFRAYDIVAFFLGVFFAPRLWRRARLVFRDKSSFFYWAAVLLAMVWLSLAITFVLGGFTKVLPAVLRAARFTVYLLGPAFIIVAAETPRKLEFLFKVLYVNVVVQAFLVFAQGMGYLPSLWPDYWLRSYGSVPVGTLSPHHKQIAVVMLIGISMTLTYLRCARAQAHRIAFFIFLAIMLVASVFSGARTFLLGFAGMILAHVFMYRAKGVVSLVLVAAAMSGLLIVGFDIVREPVTEVIETRITGRVDRFGYEGLYGERTKIYFENFPKAVARAPWVLVTGSGFQNVSMYMGGVTGGHNNYLHALMELGIVGLVVYLIFLTRVLKTLRRAAAAAVTRFQYFVASDAWVGFMGILATMLVGETLWAQYSMFTLSGQIMAYMAIASAPYFWLRAAEKGSSGAHP